MVVDSYTRYNTETAVKLASMLDKTHDVFAPGPDGRVAIRIIHEGEYLGGPVADVAELATITSPIVGEFHFVLSLDTWAVWNGTSWNIIGSPFDAFVEGDGIDLAQNGDFGFTTVTEGIVTIAVKYDPDYAIDLFGGKLGVKVDDSTIIINAGGELEVQGEYRRLFHPVSVEYDILGRPIQYLYDIDATPITVDISYSPNGMVATIDDTTGAVEDATTKTYTYDTLTRIGVVT